MMIRDVAYIARDQANAAVILRMIKIAGAQTSSLRLAGRVRISYP